MSDEQEKQEEGQEVVDQPTTEPAVEGAEPVVSEEVDERGVPIKNVIAEMNRKLDAAYEKIQELETRQYAPVAPVIPEAQKPVARKSRDEVLAEINADPEAWIQNKFREYETQKEEITRKQRLAEADKLLYEKDPKNYRTNVQKVLNIINQYGISTADPIKGVSAAWSILEKEERLTKSAREQVEAQKKAGDQIRTEQIKKTSTPAISKPKAKVVDDAEGLRKRVVDTGNERDAYNYFRNAWFNDDKK